MTTKGSNNPFPSVLLNEVATDGSDTPTPAADYRRLFLGEDGELHLIDSADVVTDVGGSGGDVATDAIWDAAGDLAVGTGSDTAARLAIGSSGLALMSNGTTAVWAAPAAHGCRVTRASGDVSIGSNTFTVVGFTSEDFDTDTMHDNSTNPSRVIVPTIAGVTTGLWMFYASGYTDEITADARVDSQLRKNAAGSNSGGTALAFDSQPSRNVVLGGFRVSALAVMSATDYVELFVRASGGSSRNVKFDAGNSPFLSAAFLGKVS